MEDLGDVSPRDQITGASVDEAMGAISRIAAMHAKYWGKVDGTDTAWMFELSSEAESQKLKEMVYLPAMEPCIENFSDFFTPETAALCREVGARYQEVWRDRVGGVSTFVQGDYRQDNLLYLSDSDDTKGMDWQISGKGKGIFDVTYFMCQSLPSEVRREVETDMLRMYVARLAEAGVPDYSFEQCWHDYRVLILGCLVYPVTVCGTLDLSNERGKALADCLLERHLSAIQELNCAEILA